MAATFIESLAEDSRVWEILGARNLLIDDKQKEIRVEVFCFSPPSCPLYHPRHPRRKVKAFKVPLSALRHLAAGSVWRDGIRVRPRYWLHHAADIIARKCELILSDDCETTDEVLRKLRKSTNLHSKFLESINYLRYEHTEKTLYIPCSEVIRTFFAPTERFLEKIMTGKADDFLDPDKRSKIKSLTPAELRAIELYVASEAGLSAARHPYKSMKLTHIKNVIFKQQGLFLLSARLPVSGLHALWTFGATGAYKGKGRLGDITTLLEPEPSTKRACIYREQYPKGRDVGPHHLLLSDLKWPINPNLTAPILFAAKVKEPLRESQEQVESADTILSRPT